MSDQLTFRDLQIQQALWQKKNFGEEHPDKMLQGLAEEFGELNHAHLKHHQKICDMADEDKFREAAADAVGDLVIYLAGYCTSMGFDLQDVVEDTWHGVVSKRDWKENSTDGKAT